MFVLPKMFGHERKHTHLSVLGLLQPEASLLDAAKKKKKPYVQAAVHHLKAPGMFISCRGLL